MVDELAPLVIAASDFDSETHKPHDLEARRPDEASPADAVGDK